MFPTGQPETRGEWLFRQMHAIYGARFVAMWRSVDTSDLKRVWTHALNGVPAEALQAGIVALCDVPHPPTLPEFLELCRATRRQAAASSPPRLPQPDRANPAKVEACLARMWAILAPLADRRPSPQWAFEMLLRGCAKNGAPLTYETKRIAIDAALSPAGRAYLDDAPTEKRAQYRAVFNAACRLRGGVLPSRVPGEDDEEPHEATI
ncbi:hypothetical protein [Paraburkholderia sp. MM6662-R1]|uniref:hypothetical protein n=1 Tax=Paraburkholderia sp. MM6662-R1 TaxID=2991066 RepID=UPI003D1A4568